MEQFAADVAEATNGHVKIEVYGNGQLGTEKEMLEQVVAGTVQGMRGGQFDFSPRLLMFTLPFLTNTRAQVTALLQSDLAQKVCAEAEGETGTVIINLCDAGGYRQFSNSKHPIKAPTDLKGLKMRTNGMPIIEIFKGAAPYVICNVIVLISISLWGPLTTALPQLLGYSIF